MDAAALLFTKSFVHAAADGDSNNMNATKICSTGSMPSKNKFETQKSLEQMYESISDKLGSEIEDVDTNSLVTENLQDAVMAQQQLSKLQASLKRKHTQCIHVIEQIHNFDALNKTIDTSLDDIQDSETLAETQV